jgi:adenylate cyclase
MRFRVRGPVTPGPEVVIAAIDEKSIDQLGRWPWSYKKQAELVDQLVAYGAAVIGYDIVFSEPDNRAQENIQAIQARLDRSSARQDLEFAAFVERQVAAADHDGIFAAALQRSARTVLGYFFHWDRQTTAHLSSAEMDGFLANIRNSKYNAVIKTGHTSLRQLPLISAWAVESNIPVLSQAAWGSGFFNNDADPDGAIRRYPLLVKYRQQVDMPGKPDYLFAPLGIRVLERYLQGQTTLRITPEGVTSVGIIGTQAYAIPTDSRGAMLINYLGPTGTFPHYSVVDIIAGRQDAAPAAAFRDKIVLIGATAEALKDLRVTPFDPVLPGVELHATMIDNILQRHFVVEPWWSRAYTLGSIVLLGVLLTVLLPRYGVVGGGLVTMVALVAPLVSNYAVFVRHGWALDTVTPLLGTLVVAAGVMLYNWSAAQKGRNYLRRIFGVYVPTALLAQMEPEQVEPELGGKSGVHTAYFTDIASFSSFSEVLRATALVDLLLEYLTAMTDILQAEQGTLDKYEGDAIVAFFGAPVPLEDHAIRAVRTAVSMQQELARLRQKWASEGDKWPALVRHMRMRIGIHSGEFVTGNMGSTQRMNYTMMGDVVNTAARLEASAKQYGVYIHCTTETLAMAGEEHFEWRFLDRVRVVGKMQAVETVEILAYKGQLAAEQVQMRAIYQQGLELYRQQQWDEAIAKFTESDKLEEMFPRRPTNPSRVYSERCEFFKANPPGQDWDGSWTLTFK